MKNLDQMEEETLEEYETNGYRGIGIGSLIHLNRITETRTAINHEIDLLFIDLSNCNNNINEPIIRAGLEVYKDSNIKIQVSGQIRGICASYRRYETKFLWKC